MDSFKNVITDEEGQGFAEYAFILLFVVIIVIVVLAPVGNAIAKLLQEVVDAF